MEHVKEHIYLGALLHDIGKFYQRADCRFSEKENDLSDYSKRIAEDICKLYPTGNFGYLHTVWTNEFLSKVKNILGRIPELKVNSYEDATAEDSFTNFACNHHRPKTVLQGIVTLADWWSAGVDRSKPETMEKETDNSAGIRWGSDRYRKVPLYSIFNEVNSGKGNVAFALHELSIDQNKIFPHPVTSEKEGNNKESYSALWAEFINEFQKLPTDSYKAFCETLLFLLKKYTWCIPSNTNDMADVSLFEHLKTTAALAHCLYCSYEEEPDSFVWDGATGKLYVKPDKYPVLMLGGDVSGIQKFIYNITSSKAAVSLKGRSFYIQLLIDSAIQRILSDSSIDATIGQVVYASGGKFYMLLPNTRKVRMAISDLRKDFEKNLWQKLYGQLALSLETVAFNYDTSSYVNTNEKVCIEGCSPGTVGDLWKKLADKLTAAKSRKFSSILKDEYDSIFKPQAVYVDFAKGSGVCAVSGIEETAGNKLVTLPGAGDKGIVVTEYVKQQVLLGTTLKDADYIIVHTGTGKNNFISPKATCEIDILGVHNYLFDKNELTCDNAEFRGISSADTCMVKTINNPNGQYGVDFLKATVKGNGTSYGFQFYGGNTQALSRKHDSQNNGIYLSKTFEELADESYLGVLRMDVDNLGSIFIQGLRPERRSFSAYSTMSFLLDTFFSGYINTLRAEDEFVDYVNVLYSGGDDIFAIGKWDRIISFAERIRKDFSAFIGRDDISISGGITIIKPKFPIAKAAQMAGDAENAAKRYRRGADGVAGKNSINIFNESLSWKDEFTKVREWRDRFMTVFQSENSENVPKSILHKIMNFYTLSKESDKSYIWQGVYSLTRTKQRTNLKMTQDLCDDIINRCLCNNSNELKYVAVAARWAELELKSNN